MHLSGRIDIEIVCWTCVILMTTGAFSPAWGDEFEDKGLAIAIEADQRNEGWHDTTGEMVMTLKNRQGEVSTRKLRSRNIEVDGDGDKSLITFDEPHSIQGTSMLTFSHKTGNDDQWLYLPAVKRVKRIASSNKAGPFMGSEFAYEDISSPEVEKYTYKFVNEEDWNGLKCFVIELYPVDKRSGYTRQVVWYDKEHYRVQKVDYYDRKDVLLKTLTAGSYRQYESRYWRSHDLYMKNHQTGKTTRIIWSEISFGNGLTERDFSRNSLAHAR
jgi:outer membrane lipoprotein-sorting protein